LELPGGKGLRRRIAERLVRPYLARQAEFNEAVLGALVEVRNDLASQLTELRRAATIPDASGSAVGIGEELLRLRRAVDALVPTVEHHNNAIGAMREVIDDQLLDREIVSQEIDLARQQAFARFHDGLGMLRKDLAELTRSLWSRAESIERRLGRAERSLSDTRLRLGGLGAAPALPDTAASGAQGSLGAEPKGAVSPLAPATGRFAELYASFEEEFRGPEGLIKERVAAYLSDLEPFRGEGTVLDVGCGRGDFLEVLKDAGIDAYGVEVSTGYAEHWKLAGLDVRVVDAAEHLASLPAGSLAALSALQVVEHLQTDELLRLIELAHEALRPGGLLILETPNPENVTVGAFTFYLDPTHDRPIPAGLLAFLVRSQGFEDVEVRYLQRPELRGLPEVPPDAPWADDLRPVRDVIEHLVFGAQDYAVVARRG
jgi:SAM-dependent methyltransferase